MKIELCDNTSVALTVCVIVIAIATIGIKGCSTCEETNRAAIAAGLVQKTRSEPTHWEKP